MPVNAFKDIRASVRRQLQDLDGNYWTDDDIDAFINEGQYDFCKQTKCLRAQAPITSLTNLETYDLPEDFLEALRLETSEGTELKQCDWEHIQTIAGNNWRSSIGNPEYWFSDLDGHKKFRMYPRPDPTVEVTGVEFEQSCSSIGVELEVRCVAASGPYLYVVTLTKIYVYLGTPSRTNIVKVISHGLDSPLSCVVFSPKVSTYLNGKTMFILNSSDGKIYKTSLLTGITAEFGTPTPGTSSIKMMCNDAVDSRWLVYTNGNGIYYTPTNTFHEYLATAGYYDCLQSAPVSTTVSSVIFLNVNAYIVTVVFNGFGYANCSIITTVSASGLCKAKSAPSSLADIIIKASLDGQQALVACSAPTVPIVNITSGISEIYGASGIVFYLGSYTKLCAYNLASGETKYFIPGSATYWSTSSCAIGNELFVGSYTNNASWDTASIELGDVSNIDDILFSSDEGVVIDIVDDEATIVFDSDYGAVVQIIEDEDAYNLWYIREPRTDVVELKDTRPLEAFALVRAYAQDKDTQSGAKAEMFDKEYRKYVAQERTRLSGAYLRGSVKRPVLHTF